jgi:LysM repeat protein
MNDKQNLNSNQDDDKTIVFSSSNKGQDFDNSDKTVVSNDSDKTQIQSSPSISSENKGNPVQDSQNSSGSSNSISNIENLKNMNKKSNTSKTAVAAGVVGAVGAGIAGAALGTIYSDEIKDAFPVEGFDAPESPEAEAKTVIPENPINQVGTASVVDNDRQAINGTNAPVDNSSTYELSATDADGNTYSVSFVDNDSDGKIDSQTANIHFVDGSSISYTETGENINPLFSNNSGIASIEDFGGMPDFVDDTNSATHMYEVQAGDTLSQIAADNDTSIANIIELNPEISDPDVIYAHQNIEIPNNDNISNPYEGGVGLGNESVGESIVYVDDSVGVMDEASTPDGSYEDVDWASFNDDPVVADNSDYDSALSQTDFDNYGSSDSYYEYGNDDVSSEFI